MNKSPLLSIIIPSFNCSLTISATIESIINQSYKNYELIIIDGLSTDSTLDILKKYASDHSNIKWKSEKDNGIYDAMNKGIKMASGEWIYFLGSDDSFYNNHILSDVNAFLTVPNVDIIYGNVNSTVYGEKYDGEFDKAKIATKNIAHQAIFYKRTIFKKLGLYDTKYKMLADWDFNLRWMIKNNIRRKHIDLVIANYAPGGKSETITDTIFYNDLNDLLYKYGYKKRSLKDRIYHFAKRFTH